jgi:hypothetical protein
MNSASKNFPHHLGVLRERLNHPTDWEQAVNYFLEEFAGDAEFVRASDKETMPHLIAMLDEVVSKDIGRKIKLEGALVSYLREHRFVHGNARAPLCAWQCASTALCMAMRGRTGALFCSFILKRTMRA